MLAIIADSYTPLLALVCLVCLNNRFRTRQEPFCRWILSAVFPFVLAYVYVALFAFIEFYFGWWLAMEGNFSSHTSIVMILAFALLRLNIRVGVAALISVFAYGYLMTILNYHSWFDILSTMFVCLPCWWMLTSLRNKK